MTSSYRYRHGYEPFGDRAQFMTGHLISGQALKFPIPGKLLEEGVQPLGAKINFLIGNLPAGAETPSAHPNLISQTEHKFPKLIDVMQTV